MFYFFIGTVFATTIGIIASFFNYVWVSDNIEIWGYILLSAFFIASFLFPALIFITKKYFNVVTNRIKIEVEEYKNDFLDKSENLSHNIPGAIIESSAGLIDKTLEYLIKQRLNSLIVRVYIWIFVAILGSVGSVLLFRQNQLIKDQNLMLLKQYEGFTNQTQSQINRWNKLDGIDFESRKKALETEILALQRETYAFSIDVASIEKILQPNVNDESTIANRIWDWWELTMDRIDVDQIQNQLDLEKSKLEIERYKFFFSPVDNRLKVMRTYPEEQQREIIIAMREMLHESIAEIISSKADSDSAKGNTGK